eukprot:g47098.t1
MGLKSDKSPGLHALHPRVLKQVSLEMVDALLIIYQHSVDSGRVPMDWRNFFEDMTSRVDNSESVDVVYLNFQKAFYKVPRKKLTRKIKANGIGDDIKLDGNVCCEEDAKRLERDLDRLAEWANTSQMQYNVDKCEVIHIGHKNRKANYYLNCGSLEKDDVQRDMGDMLKADMQVQQV